MRPALVLLATALLLASGCAPNGSERATRLSQAKLWVGAADTPPADDAPGWQTLELPDRWNRARRLVATEGWYRFSIDFSAPPTELQGVLLRRASLNAQIYVNGALVGQGGRFEPPIARNVFHATYASVPSHLIRAGSNRVDVRLRTTYGSLAMLEPIWVGPAAVLRPAYERARFLSLNVTQLAHFIAVMVALISIFRSARGNPDQPGMLWLSSGLLSFSMGSYPVLFPEVPISSRVVEWSSWVLLTLSVALGGMGLRRAVGRRSKIHDALSLGTVGFAVVLLAATPYRDFLPALTAVLVPVGLLILDGGISSARALVQGVLWPRAPLMIIAGLLLVFPVLELSTGPPEHLGFEPTSLNTPITAVCLAWFLFARIMQTVYEAQRLDAELETQQARATLERDRAIARERDRIVQDMHDGTAGHLASALSMVRAGASDSEQLATVLQDALDDLRSTIAALDPAETTLSGVLGVLRDPIERRLRPHGIALTWRIGDIDHIRDIDAADAGHLLRMIQEAVGNAVRHSGASRLEVCADRSQVGDGVVLSVTDDGVGGVGPRPGGRGLGNLERRAAALGGTLSIDSGPDGTSLVLELPGRRESRRETTPRS